MDDRLGRRDAAGQITIVPLRYGSGGAVVPGTSTRTEVAIGDGWFYWLPAGTGALPPADHDALVTASAPTRRKAESREND